MSPEPPATEELLEAEEAKDTVAQNLVEVTAAPKLARRMTMTAP